ncbi:GntR family transcriptional regulator [Pseudoroseicyclus aestuarii]|uniref:GntR family transcriptional regulator n=1 Tax=Pseudoroseicyclus aestuarii TaxID=1795041 RepID=A0A318STQ9_9RHOB|nr:GntR family transcriptional regulator [Pseudoroseicyclus aestuarii]PYE82559.1 GntR family transcriptional regulator [Pseudoroseicyclus aestuarii]
MQEKQAELDPEVERIVSAIDPRSSVAVSIQLRGALEFGIGSGELRVGQRLPSVRAMARRVGVSPVTVANVYAALQAAGHVEGRAGSGTYVRASGGGDQRQQMAEIDSRIAELIALGRDCGMTPADLSLRVAMAQPARSRPVSVLLVGNFHDASEAYAADISRHLPQSDRIEAMTLPQLEARGAGGYDLIVAPRTLLAQIRGLCPGIEVVGVTLIPNEATRVALASLRPEARVAAYSYFPGFVTIMKTGIQRFAPHVGDLTMVVRGDPGEAQRLAEAEVLILASGAEYLLQDLGPGQTAFEYRHTPEVQSIRSDILPAVETCRRQAANRRDAAE